MSDKREVIDYLRNRQKAAEIEAKVNGINLWVLLGAVAVVSWQLIDVLDTSILARQEIVLRVLLICEAAYLFSWICNPTRGIRDEVRYSSWHSSDVESPLLYLVEGVWLLLPPALLFFVSGISAAAGFVALFGVVAIALSVEVIVYRLRSKGADSERFPEPRFRTTRRGDIISDLVFGAGFTYVVLNQFFIIGPQAISAPSTFTKTLALIGLLYLLVLVTIRRRRDSHSIAWTYELETDVLLGTVSPDAALRRIEHRALGPRLQDVVDRFFDELDKKFSVFDQSSSECRDALLAVKDIPEKYQAERAAHIEKASAASKSQMEILRSDIAAFSAYLEKLNKKKSDPRLSPVLESLAARNIGYSERLRTARAHLDKMVKTAAASVRIQEVE